MDANEFLVKLRYGGAIVSSNECSEMEIVNAKATNRFFVDNHNFGYVWRTPEWLESREKCFKQTVDAVFADVSH